MILALRVLIMLFSSSIAGVSAYVQPMRYFRLHVARRTLSPLNEQVRGKKDKTRPSKEAAIYAPTILLPVTDFSQRANAIVREPELQNYWNSMNLYQKLSSAAEEKSAPRFVLHDGPPYANGDLHIGHALNKLLKDFINRYKALQGFQVHYVPGWDCHGLPIELKVLQTMKQSEREQLTPLALREKAASFAKEAAEKQSKCFQRYGVMGNWQQPYLTLQPEYEASQIRVFGEMFKKGYIFRGRKPVHWSPSSRTALAEAELEYPEGHISKSVYVGFDIVQKPPSGVLDNVLGEIRVAIWTTTPWTIPANMAVAINVDLDYCVVDSERFGKLIVATAMVETLEAKLISDKSSKLSLVTSFKGSDLVGSTYQHPFFPRISPVVAGGDYITTESGTGLVHTAPGHGQEDYLTGLKYNLELLSPVDDLGKFTIEAGEDLLGLSVLGEGNIAVIEKLDSMKALLKMEDYGHKYPYDWRTNKPTIFRATDQWFASVEGFKGTALDAIKTVKWVPSAGLNRITSFVSGRGDWCISRQRSWGVPIPVFYDKATGNEFLLDEHTLSHIQSIFAAHGSDAWWKMEVVDLLPDLYKSQADKWIKGTDTMDVWFDSGSSWAGVCQGESNKLSYPADLYLEGSDQHRGWFQSSLLTSVACNGRAPYKTVLTHGFVLDDKGYKMSKSLGNVVNPIEVIDGGTDLKKKPAYGADVLRLWVASVDYSGDVCIGDNIVKQTFESYRKLRNTARYLLGNLADFQPKEHSISYDELPSLDKWMLGRLAAVLKEVSNAYGEYQFYRATQELIKFATVDLSNFYLDVAKDRLYISDIDDFRRRSCQTVLSMCLEGFSKSIGPILPHMAEDIWQNIPYEKPSESVFEGGWPSELMTFPEYQDEEWRRVRSLREDINKQLEIARNDKLIGASLDAAAYIYASDEIMSAVLLNLDSDKSIMHPPVKNNAVDDLRSVLMISQVHLVNSDEEVSMNCDEKYVAVGSLSGCKIGVTRASGTKCERCWFYDTQVGKLGLPNADLCQRCSDAVFKWEQRTGHKMESSKQEEPVAN